MVHYGADMEPVLTLLAAVEVAGGVTAIRDRERVRTDREFGEPVADARAWIEQGATWLHLADLDAAAGKGSNQEVLQQVASAVGRRAKVQVAGGFRDAASVAAAFRAGFDRVVVDTAALLPGDWLAAAFAAHPHRVVASIEAHNGRLWAPGSASDGAELESVLTALVAAGCPGYLVTSVDREGTRKGPDLGLVRQVCATTGAPVGVAGGIAKLEHLHELVELAPDGVVAAVLDAALYRDYFSVAEAIAAVEPRFDPYRWGPAQPWGMTQGL
ncbi:MAG: phosphoribosyl isomerase [Actinomycetota bacterium]|nr:phosphoribosyl isomerase [Actinomycetota bacterium]